MTGSTSSDDDAGNLFPFFPSGDDFGVILVTEISEEEVNDDDDELRELEQGDLGLCKSG